MSEPWRVTLLGGLRAERAQQVITRFKTQKVAALFAYLAFRPKQAHPREVLIELLWPESDVPTLRNSLSVALSSLRNQFEPPGVPQGTVVRADRFSIGLNPAVVTTDVAEFEQALKAAGRAGSSLEKAQHLTRALELYQGPLLPGFYEDWIPAEQERLAGLFLDALEALVEFYEGQGDLQAAIGQARHAVSVDPLREEGQQHLIRLLAASGQPGAALRQYKDFERRLEEEVAGEPSPALRSLFRRIEKDTGLSVPAAPVSRAQPTSPPLAAEPATVTFLLTDIEEATRWSREAPEAFERARERCLALLRQEVDRRGGRVIRETGEALIVGFGSARSALAGAVTSQQALRDEEWPEGINKLRVRMALHTADIQPGGEGVAEAMAHQLAGRMLTAAHGGQVLVSEVTAALVPARSDEGIRLVDLGVYRFRDVDGARRVFQVEFPGMEGTEFGSLAADSGFRSNLPPRFTRFFGREQEIAQLQELLRTPGARLVTLTGPGGAGKTRLALECAERLEPHIDGAAYFVPLADLGEPSLIARAILDGLRVQPGGLRDPLDQAVEALNEKPTLLVLDNFEHLLEGGSQVVQTLLNRAPSVKLLITSRQLLGLSAEREFAVAPLPTPDGDESAEQLSLYDSVQLFIDRAQQVMPHFQVTSANAPAVAAVVGGLEGIPLAIELAAARVQVLTPAQMLAQLSQRLDFLATRRRDVADRQASLRAALNWSYRLLTPELQRFFARLSVFRGGWSVEAAEAVCEEPLALDYLEQLRECSLILPGVADAETIRFRMLETLREYGQERLQERREAHALRDRHLSQFLAITEEAQRCLGEDELERWLPRLESEHDNLRAALEWAGTAAPQTALRLAVGLEWFWYFGSHVREGRTQYDRILLLPEAQKRTLDRARVLAAAARFAHLNGDYAEATRLAEEALEIAESLNDQATTARMFNILGQVADASGDFSTGRQRYERSLDLLRQLGDERNIGVALGNLGQIARAEGDLTLAGRYYFEALEIARRLQERRMVGSVLLYLGHTQRRLGNYRQAYNYLEESLAIFRSTHFTLWVFADIEAFGFLAAAQGQWERAIRIWGATVALKTSIGADPYPYEREEYQENLAAARAHLGDSTFDAAWEAGRAMNQEQAIECALFPAPVADR